MVVPFVIGLETHALPHSTNQMQTRRWLSRMKVNRAYLEPIGHIR